MPKINNVFCSRVKLTSLFKGDDVVIRSCRQILETEIAALKFSCTDTSYEE